MCNMVLKHLKPYQQLVKGQTQVRNTKTYSFGVIITRQGKYIKVFVFFASSILNEMILLLKACFLLSNISLLGIYIKTSLF